MVTASPDVLHMELHRSRLLSAINSSVAVLQDILAGRVFLRLVWPIFDTLYDAHSTSGDANSTWWPRTPSLSDGEGAVATYIRATILSRSFSDHEQSKKLLYHSLGLFQTVYGNRAACTLQCMNRLASECQWLGQLPEARDWLERAVAIENTISPMSGIVISWNFFSSLGTEMCDFT